jgi:carbamoyltransferase
MIILGLSPTAHESAAGLLVDGTLVAAAAEERFTRVKNAGGFPYQAVEYCLRRAGVRPAEIDCVAYAALPNHEEHRRDLAAYGRNILYVTATNDHPLRKFRHLANYTRNVFVTMRCGAKQHDIRLGLAALGIGDKLVYVDHQRAHCASAYYASRFDRCLVVSLDGYGSGNAGAFYVGEGGRLRLLTNVPYPHSLGTFYRRVTQALGFKPNQHEGKIVGLAAFGNPHVLYDEIRARFDLDHDDYYRFKSSQDPFFETHLLDRHSREDIAAAYQRVLEDVSTEYISRWARRIAVRHVACAGGVFANVKLNQRVLALENIDQLFVFPAMGDGGVGVGAAMTVHADVTDTRPTPLHDVYLGPDYTERAIERALASAGLLYRKPANLESELADLLVANRVIARFTGAMEFGPRALGNRSILYPASDPAVNTWLNKRLRRTEFMPFAPISLDEHAAELYEGIGGVRHAAQFMTVTANCSATMRRQSPAAVHVDGTARPQLVTKDVNGPAYRVLKCYYERTGIPTLIYTSFNMHEEPIVCSPEDAIRAWHDGALDVLALGPFIVDRAGAPPLALPKEPAPVRSHVATG